MINVVLQAGIHAKAILANPSTYEILDPADFGQTRYVHIGSRLTGWNAVKSRSDQLKLGLTDEQVKKITTKIKKLADIRTLSIVIPLHPYLLSVTLISCRTTLMHCYVNTTRLSNLEITSISKKSLRRRCLATLRFLPFPRGTLRNAVKIVVQGASMPAKFICSALGHVRKNRMFGSFIRDWLFIVRFRKVKVIG